MKQAISLLLSLILGVGLRTVADVPPAMLEAAEIQLKMEAMTLEEKVGQLFLPRCPGGDDTPALLTQRLQPAGYTLYASDFAAKSPDQVRTQLAGYQAEAKIPLLLAVDEEGGSVVRVSSTPQLAAAPFDSPQNVYALGGLEALTQDTQNKCALLLDLGINLNLAPVCDISTNPSDYIYPRTMGLPPEETARAIAETVRTMEAQGLSFLSAEVDKIPQNTVAVADEDTILKIQKMLEMLEDNDDVQNVYHNADLPEEEEEE